ncbi:MAG: hypothetical protein ACFFB3_23035 [Candidatus Hodarchaeota archaeon]
MMLLIKTSRGSDLRKTIAVGSLVVLVVGALLFIYGFFSPPREALVDDTDTIPSGYYFGYSFEVPFGMSVHSEYTASHEVEFCVLDSHNFELREAESDFNDIYSFIGKSQSHTFHAPKDDIFYVILTNYGDNDVSTSLRVSAEVSWARFIYFGGIGLGAIGFIGLIAGLVLKPKMVEVPSRLLDTVKLHGRMKISELATRYKTTEADVELAVIKLKSQGEPIQFDRETREVIYEEK